VLWKVKKKYAIYKFVDEVIADFLNHSLFI